MRQPPRFVHTNDRSQHPDRLVYMVRSRRRIPVATYQSLEGSQRDRNQGEPESRPSDLVIPVTPLTPRRRGHTIGASLEVGEYFRRPRASFADYPPLPSIPLSGMTGDPTREGFGYAEPNGEYVATQGLNKAIQCQRESLGLNSHELGSDFTASGMICRSQGNENVSDWSSGTTIPF